MKKYLFFTFATAATITFFTIFGCKKNSDSPLPNPSEMDTFFVKMNQTVSIPAGGFSIRLDSVIHESRCPAIADCIWEGVVVSRFEFKKNGEAVLDTLSNGAFEVVQFADDSTSHFGFKIKLIGMDPLPLDFYPIPQADYVAKLLVELQ